MRVGLQLPSFSWPGGAGAIAPRLTEIAQAAESNGFASLWVMDHFFQLPPDTGWNGPDEPMLEAYTTLGYLARATERIALGPLVAGVHFRHPGLLLKTATTLDVLAGGRTYFGIGAGWYEREARGLGVPWPSRRERFDTLEDTLRLAQQLWSGDRRPFEGTHVRLAEPILNPMPVAKPRPRIMVGGGGERRTLGLVAQYADACNILVPDPGESRHKLEVLRRHCDEIGRPFDEIEKTSLLEIDLRRETPVEVVGRLREQAREGIEHVVVNMPDAHLIDRVETVGRAVIPELEGAAAGRG
jgi:F420-dependent oxidoreductase-like protein